MDLIMGLLALVLLTLVYVVYRLHRLEQLVLGDGRYRRRHAVRTSSDGKVVPILKDRIEHGPFGRHKRPPSDPDQP